MTFDEFYSLYIKEHKTEYTKTMAAYIYKMGVGTWCSNIKTKKLVRVNWYCSPIKLNEITLLEEYERRKQYKLLSKMYMEQLKLEQMNEDFK